MKPIQRKKKTFMLDNELIAAMEQRREETKVPYVAMVEIGLRLYFKTVRTEGYREQ